MAHSRRSRGISGSTMAGKKSLGDSVNITAGKTARPPGTNSGLGKAAKLAAVSPAGAGNKLSIDKKDAAVPRKVSDK